MEQPREESGGDIVRLYFSGEIERARLGARQLAGAGARKGARRDQLHDRGDPGDRVDPLADVVAKAPAPNRKVGHVTVRAETRAELARALQQLLPIVEEG